MPGESSTSARRFFVPRWMDPSDTNAQNANARALLSRFSDSRARWIGVSCEEPSDAIRKNRVVETYRLSRSRFWEWELALAYQSKCDAIFYPGPHWGDKAGLNLRRFLGKRTPVIALIEGIIASPESLQKLSNLFGHQVYAQPNTDASVPRIRWMYDNADHIIAISPFLARVAETLYGDKVSLLPLGMENDIFHARGRREPDRCRVVGCGTVKSSKNPETFLALAARYPNTDFVWFGEGERKQPLIQVAAGKGITNLQFPGARSPQELAEEFRRSSFFVLPSRAEGVPKVTQEAAACGLPVVVFGFYEAPSVVHNRNGLLAWTDDELVQYVGTLIEDQKLRLALGRTGAEMAKDWNWNHIAPQWEDLLIGLV